MSDDDGVDVARQIDVRQEGQHRQAQDDHRDCRGQQRQRQIEGFSEELVAEVGIGRTEAERREE